MQYNDQHNTAIDSKGLIPKTIGKDVLVIGRHRLKYLTEASRDKDFHRQVNNR